MSDFRPKCTKFDFGWGSAPDAAGWAYSASPDPLAGFRGPTSKGEGKGGRDRPQRFCWNDATASCSAEKKVKCASPCQMWGCWSPTLGGGLDTPVWWAYSLWPGVRLSLWFALLCSTLNIQYCCVQNHCLIWLRGCWRTGQLKFAGQKTDILLLCQWHSSRTSVFDQRTLAVLCSTCSWRVTTYVGKPSAVGQPNRPL